MKPFQKTCSVLLLYCLLFTTSTFAQADKSFTPPATLQEERTVLEKCKQEITQDPSNYTSLCRAALFSARIGRRQTNKDIKSQYFTEARNYAERALKVKSSDESNYVMSVAIGSVAEVASTKEALLLSKDVKKYAEAALKFNPNHGGANHVLGMWNFRVANLNFIQRAAANALFGGLPEGASNDNALKYLQKATQVQPDFILYWLDLAQCQNENDQESAAIQSLKKALSLKIQTPDDAAHLAKCKELLRDWE